MRMKLQKVDDIMIYAVISVDISALVSFAFQKMKTHNVRSIVVTEEKAPLYILSRLQAMIAPDGIRLSEITGKMQRARIIPSGTLVKDIYNDLRRYRLVVIQNRCRETIGVMSASDLIK